MAILLLESDTDVIDLDSQVGVGYGYQSHSGALGLGMPQADVQWFEGAGHGAVYRGRRVQPRSIEIPISITTWGGEESLQWYLDRLATMLSAPCRLVRVDDDGERWWCEVAHVGGADYVTGDDTNGENEWYGTLQFTAGDPTWRRWRPDILKVSPAPQAGETGYGAVNLVNTGSADTYPIFEVQGPGKNLSIRNAEGLGITYSGTIASDETLIVDMEKGRVRRSTDPENYNALYSNIATGPTLIPLKPGLNKWAVTMTNRATGSASTLAKASTTPRRVNEYLNGAPASTTTTTIRKNLIWNPRGISVFSDPSPYFDYAPRGWDARGGGGGDLDGNHDLGAKPPPLPGVTTGIRARFPNASPGRLTRVVCDAINVTPGKKYTFSVYVGATGMGGQKWRPVAVSRDSSGERFVEHGEFVEIPESDSSDPWRRLHMTFTAGEGIDNMEFGIESTNLRAGIDWMDFTAALLEEKDLLLDYFDGATANRWGVTHSWNASVNYSPSLATVEAVGGSSLQSPGGTYIWKGPLPYSHPFITECLYMVSFNDHARLYGPPVDHWIGDPWVASAKTKFIGSLATGAPKPTVGLEVKGATTNGVTGAPAAYSPKIGSTVTPLTVSANGSGAGPALSATQVRTVSSVYGPGQIVAFYDYLLERDTALGSYFDGWSTDSLKDGLYETSAVSGGIKGLEYEAKEVQQSLTTIYTRPRRWMLL